VVPIYLDLDNFALHNGLLSSLNSNYSMSAIIVFQFASFHLYAPDFTIFLFIFGYRSTLNTQKTMAQRCH
jgi:hypothetical protein